MFELYQRQQESASSSIQDVAKRKSQEFLSYARSAAIGFVVVKNPGRFIGKGGSNIRRLQEATSTLIYDDKSGGRDSNTMMVYYHEEADFAKVERAARN